MATLFQRLIGKNLPRGSTDPAEQKIAIHAFCGVINEWRRGKVTGAEAASMFDLDAGQQAQALIFKDLLDAAQDKMEFMRVFKDNLYAGEVDLDPRYTTAATVLQRLQDEVTDRGGTLP